MPLLKGMTCGSPNGDAPHILFNECTLNPFGTDKTISRLKASIIEHYLYLA